MITTTIRFVGTGPEGLNFDGQITAQATHATVAEVVAVQRQVFPLR